MSDPKSVILIDGGDITAGPGKKDVIMGLRDDPGQQLISVFVPTDDARRLLARANSLGWSRAELLRLMIKDFLQAAERGNT